MRGILSFFVRIAVAAGFIGCAGIEIDPSQIDEQPHTVNPLEAVNTLSSVPKCELPPVEQMASITAKSLCQDSSGCIGWIFVDQRSV